MKTGKSSTSSASLRLKVMRTAALLVWLALSLLPSVERAQQPAVPKRIMVLYWYNKDFPGNILFDESLQKALQSTPAGTVEYYAEYLESNRFPGENQSLLLRDYLKQKYADRRIDVVVAISDVPLDFLLKYRDSLFPNAPIVFVAVKHPTRNELAAGPGLTGIIALNTHKETLNLAMKLQPDTEQVFVISGTLECDKRLEILAREELAGYESRVKITFLTDLSVDELIPKSKSFPKRSIVLYVWQQLVNERGRVLEASDILALIAPSIPVPIYGMSTTYVGYGATGGYGFTPEANGTRIAEIALRVANGERAQDIPIENAPNMSIFDWRQLQRWGISEDSLPPGSVIKFKDPSNWDLYKYYIVVAFVLIVLQTALVGALLLQRSKRARAEESRRLSEEKFSKAFRSSPDAFLLTRQSDGAILEVNDRWEGLLGYSRVEVLGSTTLDLKIYERPEDRQRIFNQITAKGYVADFETNIRTKDGEIRTAVLSAETVNINNQTCFLIIIRDITELKKSELARRKMTGQLIHLRDEEQRRIAAELHDGLGQNLSMICNRATLCMEDTSEASVRQQLEEISAIAVSTINEVREIAHDLRPFELDRLGLVAAVNSMLEKVSDATAIRLSSDLDHNDGLLSPSAETSVYRIVQEGLNNVVKHAQATEARVEIKRIESEIVVTIKDNGRGINLQNGSRNGHDNSGFGLQGIAERVRMLGGQYMLDSKPGSGTTITVRLSVNESVIP